MNAIVKSQPGEGLELIQVPKPRPGPRDVLIRVRAASICGTDVHIDQWDKWAASRVRPPVVVGHEFCGEVTEVGSSVTQVKAGDYVSAEGHLFCGDCYFCRTGRQHICQNGRIIGIDRDGCFAELICLPASNVWPLDPAVPPEIGAIHDPLGNAVHAAFAADLAGADVAVVGCGPVGLCSIGVVRAAGAGRIFATDLNQVRRQLAAGLGADQVFAPDQVDAVAAVQAATDGYGADVVLEMSGSRRGIADAFRMLRKGGHIVLLGIPGGTVELDLADGIIFKEATVTGINGRRIFQTWYQVSSLLRAGLDLTSLITHGYSLKDYREAFALARTGDCGKVVLYP